MARPPKEFDVSQVPVGQPSDIILKDNTLAVGSNHVEAVTTEALNKGYLDELSFMEDILEVMVQESTDQNAENPVQIGVNGVFAQLFRGVPTKIRRKFVDAMIVKNTMVKTPEFIDGSGARAFKITQHHAMKYPFMLVHDPSPKGPEWLRRRLAEIV